MIACGKKEEVEVIPPYKIVVVRTCILKFLHSDPPVFASENSAWRKYPSKIGEREDTKQRNIATLFLHSA
jgi:hypothetical protein